MKAKLVTMLVVLFLFGNLFGQDEIEYNFNFGNFDYLDTLFILPGQHLWLQYGVEANNNNHDMGAIQAQISWNYNFDDFENLQYNWNHPDYNSVAMDNVIYYLSLDANVWTYRVLFNGFTVSYWDIGRLDYYNYLQPGESFTNDYIGNIVNGDLQEHWISASRTFVCTDGYLGDVNGDQVVDYSDLYTLLEYVNYDWSQGWYTNEGLNYFRGSVLFRGFPNLLDAYILSIWLQDPNDQRVQNIGIGNLMSEVNPSMPAPLSASIIGNEMTISTSGNAVNVWTFLPDGTFWQESAWVSDGEVTITIPDPNINYQVSAVSTNSITSFDAEEVTSPQLFTLDQNYPNPFNPSTTISYHLPADGPVELTIYSLTGQEIMSVVNSEQTAGNHSIVVNLGQANLSSGIYLYRLTSSGYEAVRKLSYVK